MYYECVRGMFEVYLRSVLGTYLCVRTVLHVLDMCCTIPGARIATDESNGLSIYTILP